MPDGNGNQNENQNENGNGPSDEQKSVFKGMFKEAMDEYVADKRKEQEEEENAPKRTKQPDNWFASLFGG